MSSHVTPPASRLFWPFLIPINGGNGAERSLSCENSPIILQGDRVNEFRDFLWIQYAEHLDIEDALSKEDAATAIKLTNILHVAHKYCYTKLETWVLRKLKPIFEYYPEYPDSNPDDSSLLADLFDSPVEGSLVTQMILALMELSQQCNEAGFLHYLTELFAYFPTAERTPDYWGRPPAVNIIQQTAWKLGYQPFIAFACAQILYVSVDDWQQFSLTAQQTSAILRGSLLLTKAWQQISCELQRGQHVLGCRNKACQAAADRVWALETQRAEDIGQYDIWYHLVVKDVYQIHVPGWRSDCVAVYRSLIKEKRQLWTLEKIGGSFKII